MAPPRGVSDSRAKQHQDQPLTADSLQQPSQVLEPGSAKPANVHAIPTT
jgi:hypothetical protein